MGARKPYASAPTPLCFRTASNWGIEPFARCTAQIRARHKGLPRAGRIDIL